MINEEITQKECNLAVKVGSMAYQEIRKSIEKLLAELTQGKIKPTPGKTTEIKSGKMTLEKLQKQGDGLSRIELKDPNLRLLQKSLKKNGVDFSAVKDGKGKYTLFFKGKDIDAITHAFEKYTQKLVKMDKGQNKPSINKALTAAKALTQSLNQGHNRVKNRSQGAR